MNVVLWWVYTRGFLQGILKFEILHMGFVSQQNLDLLGIKNGLYKKNKKTTLFMGKIHNMFLVMPLLSLKMDEF